MRFLIRFISRNAAGVVETSDRIVEAPAITIGRATDQVLKLRDRRTRLEHARIEKRNGDFFVTTGALAGVAVNGRSTREAKLSQGDEVEVGANIIRVIEAPEGADFAVSFELSIDASQRHFESDWSRPVAGEGRFGKRRLSWAMVAVVLIAALALPALSLLPGVDDVVRSTPLPDDGLWLAGPVHSAHSAIADDCDSCHVEAFRRVADEACIECHTVDRHVASATHAVLGESRCASCHLEHNEPPELVNRRQALCADCHREPNAGTGLAAVADFRDDHPPFRLSLLQPASTDDGETTWQTIRIAAGEPSAADRSNLSFDHAVHLDADGITSPDGQRVVDCGDCHVPEPGGAGMQPVTMDEHCSGCHTLGFDPDEPARTVPHGDPAQVVQTLVEFYSARLLGGDPETAGQRLRRPGQALTREDRDRAAAEAREQALATARDLFERRACATCHIVSAADQNAELAWRVEPVRLTQTFYPHARFSHAEHDSAVSDCASCHDAAASQSAGDVLVPGIETCRDCHGSGIARRNSAGQIPSTCVMCHDFHFSGRGQYP